MLSRSLTLRWAPRRRPIRRLAVLSALVVAVTGVVVPLSASSALAFGTACWTGTGFPHFPLGSVYVIGNNAVNCPNTRPVTQIKGFIYITPSEVTEGTHICWRLTRLLSGNADPPLPAGYQ